MTTHRAEKVADLIREILAQLIREEVRDPRVGFVTLTGVEVSPDLNHARVFVLVHGEPEQRFATLKALNHASPFLRRALGREARLRCTPDLRFQEDAALEQGFRVDELLREIQRDPGGPPDEGDPPENEDPS